MTTKKVASVQVGRRLVGIFSFDITGPQLNCSAVDCLLTAMQQLFIYLESDDPLRTNVGLYLHTKSLLFHCHC